MLRPREDRGLRRASLTRWPGKTCLASGDICQCLGLLGGAPKCIERHQCVCTPRYTEEFPLAQAPFHTGIESVWWQVRVKTSGVTLRLDARPESRSKRQPPARCTNSRAAAVITPIAPYPIA